MTEIEVQREIDETLSRIDADLLRLFAICPIEVGADPEKAEGQIKEVLELCSLREFQALRRKVQ